MATSDKMSIDKKDTVKDDSEESVGSSPDGEQTQQNAGPSNQEPQPPRRKGGRKPVSAAHAAHAAVWTPTT